MSYSKTASAHMHMADWSETVKADIDEGEGAERNGVYYPKRGLTFAESSFTYTGDMQGSSTALYLISYKEGEAPTLAFERFTGTIGGLEGSCVFVSTGTQSPEAVEGHSEVVPGMGTGQLASLRGVIDLRLAGEAPDGYPLTLRYDVDADVDVD